MSHHKLTFGEHLIAGGVAGVTEVLIMYPLDVVKTRQQLEVGKGMTMTNTFKTLIKNEGFSILYRGILPPILMEAPKRAVKFASNELYKPIFSNKQGQIIGPGAMMAGACAGMTEACVIIPFELVKVRLQAKENVGKYRNSMQAVTTIFREEGLFGFYKGLESTLWRNAVWNAAYFGLIHHLQKTFATPADASRGTRLMRDFTAGFIGGVVATTLNTPFDVVKSRIQSSKVIGKYNWTLPSLVTVMREEGVRALYKGYVPKVLRLGPGGGILKVVFDFVSNLLVQRKHAAAQH
eukprot:TRINITY_DN259_c0_g1_i1.p1 TRINITY_DN259_c0_g1~~TRINITY_DN259_c0_g1_i1.p1  ORF type:complete len:293 (-),score=119.63 TRINITY_DN259_c0_g1_i1:78-956(-)